MTCKETCVEIGPDIFEHSIQCKFDHFLSYSGLFAEAEEIKVMLYQAFQAASPNKPQAKKSPKRQAKKTPS